jgi:hypothetical protein
MPPPGGSVELLSKSRRPKRRAIESMHSYSGLKNHSRWPGNAELQLGIGAFATANAELELGVPGTINP